MANSPTKELENLWKALGFRQTPQRFLVTDKLCDRSFRENISKEDYSHYFFSENTSVQGTGKDSLQQCVPMGCCDPSNSWPPVL